MKKGYEPIPCYMWLVLLFFAIICITAIYLSTLTINPPLAGPIISRAVSEQNVQRISTEFCNPCTVEVVFSPEFRGGKWSE